jgi:probable HAF family extracellular repeat protein
MTRHVMSIVVLMTALIIAQHSVTAQKPGRLIDLGTLGGTYSDAFGINNDPAVVQVVGQSRRADGTVHAFFWTPSGPIIDLGTLAGTSTSRAMDINNHGQIAGVSGEILAQQAVVWTMNGGSWVVEALPTLTGACCASAEGLNNGTAGDPLSVAVAGSSHCHAVLWRNSAAGWTIQDLGALPGDTCSIAHDVNNQEAVVGNSHGAAHAAIGFLWTAATGMLPLPTLGGETYALAINDNGDVAGLSTDVAGNRHAVRWSAVANWAIEDLGTLGGCCSQGFGINSFGDVVGVSGRSGQRAFLANSLGMVNLGEGLARDLNDFGNVVGARNVRGGLHAVLWTLN